MGEDALPLDAGCRLPDPAEIGLAQRQDLEPPAPQIRVALVHAEQVPGEERRLLAAGAGADLEDGALLVRRVPRQQQHPQPLLQRRQPFRQLRPLGLGQLAHLGVAAAVPHQGREIPLLELSRAERLDPGDDRLQLRQLPAQAPIVGSAGRRQEGGQLLLARQDGVELLVEGTGAHDGANTCRGAPAGSSGLAGGRLQEPRAGALLREHVPRIAERAVLHRQAAAADAAVELVPEPRELF